MAEAYAKASRTPGGVSSPAAQGPPTPALVFTAPATTLRRWYCWWGRCRDSRGQAGQEIDYTHFFGSLAKWVIEVNDPRRLPDVITRAFHLARSGRPGRW